MKYKTITLERDGKQAVVNETQVEVLLEQGYELVEPGTKTEENTEPGSEENTEPNSQLFTTE